MKDKILIVTSKEDEHANYIIDKCNSTPLKDKIIRLNTEDFIDNVKVSFNGTDFFLEILDSQKSFTNQEIKTVWYRRPIKPQGPYNDPGVNRFLISQVDAFLEGLYYCTHDSSLWINDLRANYFAKNKLLQLKLAKSLGMKVPATLITNKAENAIAFSKECQKICNKSLTIPRYTIGQTQYPYMTRVIGSHEEIVNNSASIDLCPTLFQEYIDKKSDLRVVVFRDRLFAFEIFSQTHEFSKTDVRGIDPAQIEHKYVVLPEELQCQILEFVQKQNMVFSSMDFVLTKSGEYIFIENNCNGQWLWLEYITGVPMSDTFIKLFFE